jgi:hypothetical protein
MLALLTESFFWTTSQRYVQAAARFLAWAEEQDLDPLITGKKELKEYLYYLTGQNVIFRL